MATGHYVRRVTGPGRAEMHRAADPAKDQSYFLFATTAEQLDFLRFPLGAMDKAETRALAERFGLAVADKPDSQDICFVPDGGYARIVEKLRPEAAEPGEIVDLEGRVMGRHDGIIGYTIGQRKGLGIGGRKDSTDPLYVVRLEPETRRVVIGPRDALACGTVRLGELNWLGGGPIPSEGLGVQVKLRSTMATVPATLYPAGKGSAEAVLDDPAHGVSPGQACVFYDGERVLGGGWILREEVVTAA